jgi:GntR family transcriptional repressor for pyruvate dehydrogenase complex
MSKISDVAKPPRSFEAVASRIRAMISDGSLRPGDKLPSERELSSTLRVGRNAVREALRTLEQAGVLQLRIGKTGGAFVTSGNPDVISANMRDLLQLGNISFDDLWETRLLLTDIVVRLAIERMSSDDIAALEANVERAVALYDAGRLKEKSRCNIDFHDTLAAATKNPLVAVLMASLSNLVRHFTERLGSDPSRETLASRRRFMVAVQARNAEAAIDEMRSDLNRVHDFYRRLAREAAASQGNNIEPPVHRLAI